MKYHLLTSRSSEELVLRINAAIEKGWIPCGGPVVAVMNQTSFFYQAMVEMGSILVDGTPPDFAPTLAKEGVIAAPAVTLSPAPVSGPTSSRSADPAVSFPPPTTLTKPTS